MVKKWLTNTDKSVIITNVLDERQQLNTRL